MDFIFTPSSFKVDGDGSFSYEDLYGLCFKEEDKEASLGEKFLYSVATLFIKSLLNSTGLELKRENIVLETEEEDIKELSSSVPYSFGYENVDASWVKKQFKELLEIYKREIKAFKGSVDLYFRSKSAFLSFPTRIYFHLVENPSGASAFAFMATYTTVDDEGSVHHYPLRYALREFRGRLSDLSALIAPVSHVSSESALISHLVESGEIFYPLNFTMQEAYTFLQEVPLYEDSGIVCRIPRFWKDGRKSTSVSLSLNKTKLSVDGVLSFKPSLYYQGVRITEDELRELMSQSGLAMLKGKWVEADKARLQKLLDTFNLFNGDISVKDAVGYSTGLKKAPVKLKFSASWLDKALKEVGAKREVPSSLKTTLRPYQVDGYRYISAMSRLSLGLTLADDMGLGKTVQVISFLLDLKSDKKVLLVIPASLIGNWCSELDRFAPSLKYSLYYGSSRDLKDTFLTITTYSIMASDSAKLSTVIWDEVILDEAQNIKNSGTKQASAARALPRRHSIALTGTPIENNLMNLWSIMEFANSGFLGQKASFSRFASSIDGEGMQALKEAINPFILRRLKTDKKIISDLPDKVENDYMVPLTKKQIVLYEEVVSSLERSVAEEGDEAKRKMMILPVIMKLKQICNHPDQYNGEGGYRENESGKFELLRTLTSTMKENREKVLVFTQFTEIIPALDLLLADVYGQRGRVIDGSLAAKKRKEIVDEFQKGDVPYLVLSLRAAGVGLNLTAAVNVIHFDRWWNPAVENQATDRAYRIGQKHKVMVYKFISKDTIEEKIDAMIKEKSQLADELLSDTSKDVLSALTSKEILNAMKFSGEVK